MFFDESGTIANEHESLRPTVKVIDAFLRDNREPGFQTSAEHVVRHCPELDVTAARSVLTHMVTKKLLVPVNVARCAVEDRTFPLADRSTLSETDCPLCGERRKSEDGCVEATDYRIRDGVLPAPPAPDGQAEEQVVGDVWRVHASGANEVPLAVVFIHGLGGHRRSTWVHRNGFDWPKALGAEFRDVDVYTLSPPIPLVGWNGASARLPELVPQLADDLRQAIPAKTKLFFVVHSMGGLVYKQMVRDCATHEKNKPGALLPRIAGVAFAATPHFGSAYMNGMRTIFGFLLRSKAERSLGQDDAYLIELNNAYREWHNDQASIACNVFVESRPLFHPVLVVLATALIGAASGGVAWLLGGPLWWVLCGAAALGVLGWAAASAVVSPSSADPGLKGVRAMKIVGSNHNSVVKLKSEKESVYRAVLQSIRSIHSGHA